MIKKQSKLNTKSWLLAIVEGLRYYPTIVPSNWWQHWPFLPLPSYRFIKFRLDTAYGDTANGWRRPTWYIILLDTKRFLLWRRRFRLQK